MRGEFNQRIAAKNIQAQASDANPKMTVKKVSIGSMNKNTSDDGDLPTIIDENVPAVIQSNNKESNFLNKT